MTVISQCIIRNTTNCDKIINKDNVTQQEGYDTESRQPVPLLLLYVLMVFVSVNCIFQTFQNVDKLFNQHLELFGQDMIHELTWKIYIPYKSLYYNH